MSDVDNTYFIEILQQFQKWNPEIVNMMRNCSHHFDSENLTPFHLENDVWTHTILMYKDFIERFNRNEMPYNIISNLMPVIILCHDIGKIYTRHVPKGEYGKVAFYNHAFASVQPAIDFLAYSNFHFSSDEIYYILNVISNHMEYFDADIDKKYLLANKKSLLFKLGENMNFLDKKNSIDVNLRFLDDHSCNILSYVPQAKDDKDVDIYMYCGCPGSGKDYLAERDVGNIVSYDQIREDIYLEEYPERCDQVNRADLYKEAWQYCNDKNFDLNTVLYQRVVNLVENGEEVAICNTNLTRKARRSIAGLFHKYKIGVRYVIADSKTFHNRNENRESKNLDRKVMNKFIYNQQVPSLFDFKGQKNVNFIEMEYNG